MYVSTNFAVHMTICHGICRNALGWARDERDEGPTLRRRQLAGRLNYRIQRAITELCEIMGFPVELPPVRILQIRDTVSAPALPDRTGKRLTQPVFQHPPHEVGIRIGGQPQSYRHRLELPAISSLAPTSSCGDNKLKKATGCVPL
jgi:hypothetical protein